jgi:hypothetical protein
MMWPGSEPTTKAVQLDMWEKMGLAYALGACDQDNEAQISEREVSILCGVVNRLPGNPQSELSEEEFGIVVKALHSGVRVAIQTGDVYTVGKAGGSEGRGIIFHILLAV